MSDSSYKDAEDRATEFLCNIRFHKSIILPPNPTTSRLNPLRVTYADYGYHPPIASAAPQPVVLFCGPLMGGRLAYAQLDALLKRHHVRLIHPDRPGIGGSHPVKLQDRISIWLEIVPYLLSTLKISHVSLASHSGGVIYALNTLLRLPHLLHPATPYVAFFAPWVHYSHSGISSLAALKYLPTPIVGKFASLTRFVNNNVIPVVGYSGNLISSLKHSTPAAATPPPILLNTSTEGSSTEGLKWPSTETSTTSVEEYTEADEQADREVVTAYDAVLFNQALSKLTMSYVFAEAVDGISDDAKLFLRKGAHTEWSAPLSPTSPSSTPRSSLPTAHAPPDSSSAETNWTDLDTFVPALCSQLAANTTSTAVLTIDAFHAVSDNMVGERGRVWFDDCWDAGKWPEGVCEKLKYRSEVGPPGTDHNFLIAERFGLSEMWAERVRQSFPV